jgi:hypothetical protein
MKFLTMITTHNPKAAGAPPAALMQAIGEHSMLAGKSLEDSGGMSTTGILTVKDGELMVDGPYAEAREVIGGFAVVELETKEDAIEWTRKFIELHRTHWPIWEGDVIVRRMIHFPQ